MHGDPEALRALSRQVAALAEATREAAAAVDRARRVDWVSTAAERYRGELATEVGLVVRCSAEIDEAARALAAHAEAVERRQAQIRAAERFVAGLLDDAQRRLARAVDDGADEIAAQARQVLAAARSLPAVGSLEWVPFAGRWGF